MATTKSSEKTDIMRKIREESWAKRAARKVKKEDVEALELAPEETAVVVVEVERQARGAPKKTTAKIARPARGGGTSGIVVPEAKCPVCKKFVSARNGKYAPHTKGLNRLKCPGSGEQVKQGSVRS